MLPTIAFRTLESIVAEINVCNHLTLICSYSYNVLQLLASPPILENKSLTNFSHPGIHKKEDMVHVSPELDMEGSGPSVHISSYTYVPHQPRRQPSPNIHQPFNPHAPSALFTPHQSPSDEGDKSKTPAHPSVVTNRYDMFDPNKDYRTDLNNLCMQYRWSLDIEEFFSGPQHNVTWTSTVIIDGVVFGRGSASSIRASREKASYQTLVLLGRA
ncbi:hypothetical protein EDD85DRAFT_141943 [Armillaria nabsnona]|nr:hypothetical protein EDD85DRAFT_141943 [Armillaria nabsnona]